MLRLGIAGLGNVGAGLVDLIEGQPDGRYNNDLSITGVSARNRSRPRPINISKYTWHDDPVDLARSDDIDVFVELVGGSDGPAKKAVETALASGKHVVTANKALIAEHGMSLATQAEAANVNLYFEAAVAGAIPVVRVVRESLAGSRIAAIKGILNGTCNYLLTEIVERRASYADVLADAQRLGYAEADPYLDVSGTDAAHKIAILSAIAFGAGIDFDKVSIAGVTGLEFIDLHLADRLGFIIRLIAEGSETEDGVTCRVEPLALPKAHPLAHIKGSLNAVLLDVERAGPITLTGAGAGAGPTASAVMGDVVRLIDGSVSPPFAQSASAMKNRFHLPTGDGGSGSTYFLSITLVDEPGALAALTDALAKDGVSVDSLVQEPAGASGRAAVALTTHVASSFAMQQALARVQGLNSVVDAPRLIRIEGP